MNKLVKIIAIILVIMLSHTPKAFCDTIITPAVETHGRIKTVGAGLIQIRNNGSDLTYQREVNNEYYGDVVMYKKNPLSRKIIELTGRVEGLDRMNAIIYTPMGKVEIQRYKIKNIIMKVPNKGY